MTDVPPEAPAVPPDVQAALDQIAADQAAAEAAAAQALQAEEDRVNTMLTAKQVCEDACGPISAVMATTTDSAQMAALVELQNTTHAAHAADVEAAYSAFAAQPASASNPAAEGVTEIDSGVTAAGGATG